MAPQKNVQPAPVRETLNGEEIDFFDLFNRIWAGRFLILSIVVVVAIFAYVGLKLMPKYYKIEATIDSTPKEQLRPLFPTTVGLADYQVPYPDEKKLYSKILLQAGAIGNLKAFWEVHIGHPIPDDSSEAPEDYANLNDFIALLKIEPENPKTPEVSARKISLENTDRVMGVKLLNDYLEFLGHKAWKDQVSELESSYRSSLTLLEINYHNRSSVEERRLSDSLVGLRESLKIASSMGIFDTPFKQLENIQIKIMDSRDYLLGVKSLSAQIEILSARQGKSLAPYSSDLRNLENVREQITSDMLRLKELEGKVRLFAVVNPPEASLTPVRPKKALIFIGIVFFSGIFGVALVLIRSAIQRRIIA